ncbi:PGAP1-like protein-domain-containing protein [Radiomyces spectabilis]|uniref:PGAP1-like protein-domain-containing protein n=1 Tax=Radiomyces spectabilis TaxID=64574 RepID=UPI00221E3B8D|nr:PGAP1-like protein-domain-containing protein [Radiomyces spectabilis]KAI8391121.1 PGAP1-like protein-domain-containing protein [Radiomyces spectabilis]
MKDPDSLSKENQSPSAPHLRIDRSPPIPLRSRDSSNSSSRTSSPSNSPSPPLSPSTTQALLPSIYHLTRASRLLIFCIIFLSILGITVIIDSFQHHQRDKSGCRMSYMRPYYIKQTGFDSEMTRFAGKYGLYLYREADHDYYDYPTGVPVLFIPGHAGSYKQVRSLSAEAAYYYYQHYAQDNDAWNRGVRSLDFFTVDFHEEFSALHGQSLLEQAEYLNDAVDYILKLYIQSRKLDPHLNSKLPDPTSIIIVGHSMGGIVARTMFTLPNYQPGSINSIITLSTPHILPPVAFDWKISQIYKDIYRHWTQGFSDEIQTNNLHHSTSLKDVMLISIAGGTLDNTVNSDAANVGPFLPATNGFTVFTTAVPHVWTAANHVSILSCNQFVKVLAKSLLDIVDVRRGSQTQTLEDRMRVMRKALLTGLEDRRGDGSDLMLDTIQFEWQQPLPKDDQDERLIILGDRPSAMHFLPRSRGKNAYAVLTDQLIGQRFDLLLCKRIKEYEPNRTRMECRIANSIAVPVPASTKQDTDPFSGNEFRFASIAFAEMSDYEYVAIRDKGGRFGFLIAESFNTRENTQVISTSMIGIAVRGIRASVKPSLFSSIRIPSIENSMLGYHLKLSRPSCDEAKMRFTPFLRQSIASMHESKFYVNLASNNEETELSLHGRTAFSSAAVGQADIDHRGLLLQVWMDPVCPQPVNLELSIDWYGSAGRLGFRNGIMLATSTFIIVMLVFVAQIQAYNNTGIFPHFGQGLMYCLRRTLPIAMLLVSLCSIYQCFASYALEDMWDLPHHIKWHDVLAGNSDPFFWWLPLLGLLLGVGIMSLLWLFVEASLRLCTLIPPFFQRYLDWQFWPINRAAESRQRRLQRRVITITILFILVATVITYQFVFVVAFFVHIVTCTRSLIRKRAILSRSDRKETNRYHYMQSVLLLLITLLPFNLPILLVWIRNLAVHWYVPFSSDHNVLAIAPFMMYVEALISERNMLPRQTSRYWRWTTYFIFYGIIAYAFMYGIKYTHVLYLISNYLVVWLLILHFRDSRYCRLVYHYALEHLFTLGNKKLS